jgi:hypothetical protein
MSDPIVKAALTLRHNDMLVIQDQKSAAAFKAKFGLVWARAGIAEAAS